MHEQLHQSPAKDIDNSSTAASLIAAASRKRNLPLAFQVYDSLVAKEEPLIDVFRELLDACRRAGESKKMLSVWTEMQLRSVLPDKLCFSWLAMACYRQGSVSTAKELYQTMKSGKLKFTPNVIDCTQLIQTFSSKDQVKDVLNIMDFMDEKNIAVDHTAHLTLLKVSADMGSLALGKKLHSQIRNHRIELDVKLQCALITMYAQCGSLQDASNFFQQLKPEGASTAAWNAMISAYRHHGLLQQAVDLFEHMQGCLVKTNLVTWTLVIAIQSELGNVEKALQLFDNMQQKRLKPDLFAWNAIISACSKTSGYEKKALDLFDRMQEQRVKPDARTWTALIGSVSHSDPAVAMNLFQTMQKQGVKPDEFVWSVLLTVCANSGALDFGQEVHQQLQQSGVQLNTTLVTALINMYAKCGSLTDARTIFASLNERELDTAAWNAMIAGCGQHGSAEEALELFKRMQQIGVKPNETTLVTLLNTCSHAGLVDLAKQYLASMERKWNIRPTDQHRTCVVDALARAGHLEEAEHLISTMENADVVAWTTLLSGCRLHKDVSRAKQAAKKALRLSPKDSSVYVLLANTCASSGNFKGREAVQQLMEKHGVKKISGQSSICIDGHVHKFTANDKSHPQISEIHAELQKLSREMKAAGYRPDTSVVLHEVEPEEKEQLLCYHSEKLAIAYGLISTPPNLRLVIIKNLRICSDCHNATKYISQICNREITLRDGFRFHHFKDGKCSCGEYF